jgi:hypothetical protein
MLISEYEGTANCFGSLFGDGKVAKLKCYFCQVSRQLVEREGQQGQYVITRVADTIHTDSLVGVATCSKYVRFVLDQTTHVHDMPLRLLGSCSVVISVVETDSHSRTTGLTIKGNFCDVAPRFVLRDGFEVRKFHGDRCTSSADQNWLGWNY